MKLLFATVAATVLAGLATVQPAEARCFWNGIDMECHYPVRPHTVYREVYREAEPVYEAPRVIHREVIERTVEAPEVIYHEDWR